ILQNCDELFEREEFSAAPDVSWPDCFNSGVFVPSVPTDYAHAADLIQLWWNIFFDNVHSNLNDQM
ncbi:hypothetical protein DOY81_015555, partial [Sarcophaga bullata]